jgi:hypothetical protein
MMMMMVMAWGIIGMGCAYIGLLHLDDPNSPHSQIILYLKLFPLLFLSLPFVLPLLIFASFKKVAAVYALIWF